MALAIAPVAVEDHSRSLKRLRDLHPAETNTAEARKEALEAHRAYLDAAFRARATLRGLRLDPASPFQLELTITSLGEVRTRYIVYGIASGVAWGVGTGLATHNPQLALGLGAYELVEESLFWIAGSSLFGRYSAPVVVEARVFERGKPKPLWEETYYAIWGGTRLRDFPEADRRKREIQLQASLERIVDKVFADLSQIPGTGMIPESPMPPEPDAATGSELNVSAHGH